jgi:poly-gamma-glutamate capsule biosynthesis protein CapA/YwtB (metallophosphatase superfamily)
MFSKNNSKGFHTGSLFFVLLLTAQLCLNAQSETISIIGVGDMMLGTNYPSKSYLPANGGKDLLADVKAILKDADVTFGNLEGTMFDGEGTAKTCRDMSKCYVFRSPASYVEHFTDAGFDVLSIANNHSGDFGPAGRNGTKSVLKKAGLEYAGLAGTDETAIFERNGCKFGFCAFAPNSGTCDIRDIAKAKEIVTSLEKQCDIVIVSFHGGAEGADNQHVPKKTETYLGENRGDVHKFAHAVIDAGADVVFGHGPHVTRAVELYKDRFIAYSLGNFCTYGRFSLSGPAGIAPIVKIFTDKKGAFVRGEITPVYQQKTHGPKIDRQKQVISKIKELTAKDFPDAGLDISSEGKISKK